MSGVNKQIILGHIGQIEKKSFEWGSVTKFSIATNEKFTKKDGSKVEETTWFNCEAFGAMADNIDKFFSKGDPIYVEGKTKVEKYEKDGQERQSYKVKVEMFSFVPSPGKGKSEQAPQAQPAESYHPAQNDSPAPWEDPAKQTGGDDLPF